MTSGMPSLRFNFRVSAPVPAPTTGQGEVQDALAAVRYGRERWPQARLWLAGFSFGAAVAVRASGAAAPVGLVAVAPAVDRMDIGAVRPAVRGWCCWAMRMMWFHRSACWNGRAALKPPPAIQVLAGAGSLLSRPPAGAARRRRGLSKSKARVNSTLTRAH